MLDAARVCALLKECAAAEGFPAEKLLPFCQRGVDFVLRRLKAEEYAEDPRAAFAAAAASRYYLFVSCLGSEESFRSFKVGDMTVQRDAQKELQAEKQLFSEALSDAAEILKDGGFYFEAG